MTVDEYLANLEPEQRAALQHIRELIEDLVPEAEESMSYGMPAFKYRGKPLVYFAAFKDHLSIFPTSEPAEAFQEQLKDFKTSKGTIQFTLAHPLPDALIKDVVLYRIETLTR